MLLRQRFCTKSAPKVKTRMGTQMSAWQIFQYGGNEELTQTTTARVPNILKPTDLLIEIHAASVNPIDTMMRGGYGKAMINLLRQGLWNQAGGTEFPLILGRDFSGVVMETGKGVTRYKPGDEVWGAIATQRQGTHAQYCIVGQSEISHKPKSLSHIEAASLPYVAVTTWTALCLVGELTQKNAQNKRVLIHGGAGGLGTFAIQLMKTWGAEVTTTCSTDAVGLVQSLGADVVIDYKTQDVQSELQRISGFDVVLDPLGGKIPSFSVDLLKGWRNSKYVSLVTPVLSSTDKFGIPLGLLTTATNFGTNIIRGFINGRSYRWALFIPNGNALGQIAKLVDNGKIEPVIDKVYTFDQVPDAFQKVEEKHGRGKTVISIKDS
ncbi:hypothetical protein CHS0354_010931 [Potamilus streckersoni]|uniref:NAD(P)H oxidoreductase RTN4IP1, mitochondrial n=1 Tax=Potamilus streckersoni TaxID=2493646 RepID=A0AAE0W1Z1_9BIVA|nr:hypothetical protein CHS0354_010931 [Potamilus streckersoni]